MWSERKECNVFFSMFWWTSCGIIMQEHITDIPDMVTGVHLYGKDLVFSIIIWLFHNFSTVAKLTNCGQLLLNAQLTVHCCKVKLWEAVIKLL